MTAAHFLILVLPIIIVVIVGMMKKKEANSWTHIIVESQTLGESVTIYCQ